MAQFQYTAVNGAGKKLSGVIGATSEEEARKELNALGISVLAMKQIAKTDEKSVTKEAGTSKELPKFEFEAYDKTGRKVIGTIPAGSRYKAFKRLMEEYRFEVSYVVKTGASQEEKMKAKEEDLSMLKAEYEEQMKKEGKFISKEEDPSYIAFQKKRDLLLVKVDQILTKIKALLEEYKDEIKAENRRIIQSYIDKLLRIKSSTNLDYIAHTSEELLKKVQDQELFLHKEKMKSKREALTLETQKLMAELHSGPAENKDLSDDLANLQEKLMLSNSRILRGFGQFINSFLPSEEEKRLKSKIATLNTQIFTYYRIWFKTPKSSRASLISSINELKEDKKRHKHILKNLRKEKKNKKEQDTEMTEPLITEEITYFLGWLLAFYLLAYFFSYYALTKSFAGGNPLPNEFNLLNSATLRALLMSVFLWYTLLSIHIEFFRNRKGGTLILLPIGILMNAIILFNF